MRRLKKNQNNLAKYARRQRSRKIAAKKKQQMVHTISDGYVLDYHALSLHCDRVANRITNKTF